MIVQLLYSERESGEVIYMPEELDVADELEMEETHRGGQRRTGGGESNQVCCLCNSERATPSEKPA